MPGAWKVSKKLRLATVMIFFSLDEGRRAVFLSVHGGEKGVTLCYAVPITQSGEIHAHLSHGQFFFNLKF